METTNIKIENTVFELVGKYTEMDINTVIVHCPYWANKIKDGRVVLRGFLNGKGSAWQIREELTELVINLYGNNSLSLTSEDLKKLARRKRIGIDCSGFAYRLLEILVKHKYKNCQVQSLNEIFTDGINRTNANTLTSTRYCDKVHLIKDYRLGDLMRINGGKHVAIILELRDKELIYVHTSQITQETGTHYGIIKITDINKQLIQQEWLEKTHTGENFGEKYFNQEKGDGVFRLKIFH